MSGRLTVNKITNCKDLTIKMDNAKVIGNYSSLQINDVKDSDNTTISMRKMKVMTHEEYRRSLESKAGHSRGYRGGDSWHESSGHGGSLTVNHVRDCRNTTIDERDMNISGNFENVTMNDVARSEKTSIDMSRAKIQANQSDDSSDDSSSDDEKSKPTQETTSRQRPPEVDEYGLPLRHTYAYYVAPKFTFSIRLGRGSKATCTFLQEDRVCTVKNFLAEIQPKLKGTNFRLQVVKDDDAEALYVCRDPEATLKEAGFCEKLELKVVVVTPEGDIDDNPY